MKKNRVRAPSNHEEPNKRPNSATGLSEIVRVRIQGNRGSTLYYVATLACGHNTALPDGSCRGDWIRCQECTKKTNS